MEIEQIAESIRAGVCPGNPMEVIPSALRMSFRASEGKRFVCADLSLIEVRVIGWLTGCHALNAIFAADRDPYIEFAAELFNVPYDQVTKLMRQIAKPAVLQCGFGAGGGQLKEDKNGDIYKSGLWGYAESMSVAMTQEQAAEAVAVYRESYPEVPRFWYALEDRVRMNIEHNYIYGTIHMGGVELKLGAVLGKLLYIVLPSGRRLHYLRPALLGDDITFEGLNSVTKQWGRRKLYGSLLTENIVQAIARDVLAVGMVRATDAGFTIVAHTHDELLCEENVLDTRHNLAYLSDTMTAPVSWAPGLLIKADGWEGEVYRK